MDFSELYKRYANDLFRFALFLCGNRAVAEDLVAETFARALSSRDTLRASTVKGYLFAIARNLHRDVIRGNRRISPLTQAAANRPDPAPSPERAAGGRIAFDAVLEAVQRLPEADRDALLMAMDESLSYEQIAAILGCSVGALKVRIHRARAKVRLMVDRKDGLP